MHVSLPHTLEFIYFYQNFLRNLLREEVSFVLLEALHKTLREVALNERQIYENGMAFLRKT